MPYRPFSPSFITQLHDAGYINRQAQPWECSPTGHIHWAYFHTAHVEISLFHSIYAGMILSTRADDVILFNPGQKKKKKGKEYDIFKEVREILREALLKVLSFL